MTLKDCLERCLVVELRAIARQQSVRLHSLIKNDIVSQLEAQIPRCVAQSSRLAELPQEARLALTALLDAGGSAPIDEIELRFGQFRDALAGGMGKLQPWADGRTTPLDELHGWGLAFRVSHPGADTDRVEVPSDLMTILRPAAALPRIFRTATAPPTNPAEGCDLVQQDLMLMASIFHETPASLIASGEISRRDLQRANTNSLQPDDVSAGRSERSVGRFWFLRCLGQSMGLLDVFEGQLVAGENLRSWLALPSPARHWQTLQAYLGLSNWIEMDLVPTVEFQVRPEPPVLAAARRFLAGLLAQADPGEWCTLPSLIQAARTRNSFLLRQPGNDVRARNPETGLEMTPREWVSVEGAWLEACLRGPFWWFGLVDIGRNRRGEVSSFRVRPAAIPILAALSWPTVQDVPAVLADPGPRITLDEDAVVEPDMAFDGDLTLTVRPNLDLEQWFRLERICERIERRPAIRYRISQEKIRLMLQAGEPDQSVLDILGNGIPDPTRVILAGWMNRFGQVSVYCTTVLSVAEQAILTALRTDPLIAACLGEPLGTRACAVVPGTEADLVARLRATGEMPRVSFGIGQQLPAAAWSEIYHGLAMWKHGAAGEGLPGPSESTWRAVESMARLQGEIADQAGQAGDPVPAVAMSLEFLNEAIRRKRTIVFDYHAQDNELAQQLIVLPRALSEENGVTFLCGYRKGSCSQDRFHVEGIQNASFHG